MYVAIDHYDSFIYNLVRYFNEIGENVKVVKFDKIPDGMLEKMYEEKNLDGIIISPGPKGPWDCRETIEVVKKFKGLVPVLGVCLGHQIISYAFGAVVKKGRKPMHGKVSLIHNNSKKLFNGLPPKYKVTRYHSLMVDKNNFPEELRIDAVADDGTVMAVSHRTLPVYGVQFHPEAVLIEYGHELIKNFCMICKESRIA